MSNFLKKSYLFMFSTFNTLFPVNNAAIQTDNIKHVYQVLQSLPPKTRIFLDIDDTIITPCSHLFRANSPHKMLIDDIKKNRESIPNADNIIGNWRKQRSTMLVCKEWPEIINNLKKHFPVHALTKIDTGTVGQIESMEQWRYNELASHGILFSDHGDTQAPEPLLDNASHYHGIFMTGKHKKSDLLRKIIDTKNTELVVLVDDREEHINDVATACKEINVHFLGILLEAFTLIPGRPNPTIAQFQKEHLINTGVWLEDDAATAFKAHPKEQ